MTRHDHDGNCSLAIGALVICFALAAIIYAIAAGLHVEYRECTVTDKDRTTTQQGKSDARIYTADCGTLRVGDSWFEGTWSSSDTYASIEPGKRYAFKTRGYRIPVISAFPNIVEAKPIG